MACSRRLARPIALSQATWLQGRGCDTDAAPRFTVHRIVRIEPFFGYGVDEIERAQQCIHASLEYAGPLRRFCRANFARPAPVRRAQASLPWSIGSWPRYYNVEVRTLSLAPRMPKYIGQVTEASVTP